MTGARDQFEGTPVREFSAREFAFALAGVAFVAALLRFAGIGRGEFVLDEYCSLLTAFSESGMWHALRNDTNAPLYFVLLRPWVSVFGDSEAGARSLSVVFGVFVVGAMGLWVRDLASSRRAGIWAAVFAALAPLQIYYSQLARGYALLDLLVVLSIWSFFAASRSGRAALWVAHGVGVLAGLYTHNLFLPFIGAFWLAALFIRLSRRAWIGLAIAHAVALVLYFPWFQIVREQAQVSGLEWIVAIWKSTPPAMTIPRSLLIFGLGGSVPEFEGPLSGWIGSIFSTLSAALSITLAAGVVIAVRRGIVALANLGSLLAFLFVPLVFMFGYSVLVRPIYVPGRYDIIAQPAFLGLAAIGAPQIEVMLTRERSSLRHALMIVTVLIGVVVLGPHYAARSGEDALRFPNRARAAILQQDLQAGDLVVCLGYGVAPILFEAKRRGIENEIVSFPASTRDHPGWMNAREEIESHRAALGEEARKIAVSAAGPSPRHPRIWLLVDPGTSYALDHPDAKLPLAEIAGILFQAVHEAGLTAVELDEESRAQADRLGMTLVERRDGP